MYFWFSFWRKVYMVWNIQSSRPYLFWTRREKKRCFASRTEALVLPSQVDPVSRKQIENISTPSQSSLSCQPLFFFFPLGSSRLDLWHQSQNSSPEPACRCYVSLCWWGFSSIVWKAWPRGFYCWISVVRMIQTFGEKWGQCNHKETQPFTLRVWRKIYFWRLHLWMLTRQFFFFSPNFSFFQDPDSLPLRSEVSVCRCSAHKHWEAPASVVITSSSVPPPSTLHFHLATRASSQPSPPPPPTVCPTFSSFTLHK